MRLLTLPLALQSPPDTAHIVIVATTDIHGRVFGWDYVRDAAAPGGLSRAATAIEILRGRYPGTLVLVDAGDLLQGDRKSTRLNSSHLVISYAVFCLKKKKRCQLSL